MITPSYFPRLQEIRSVLEKVLAPQGFPKDFCVDAAEIVSQDLGFDIIRGYKLQKDKEEEAHAWNYDHERRWYVDLTYDQFGDYPPVLVFKSLKRYKLVENSFLYLEWDPRHVSEALGVLNGNW
ncbi:hypothetical protein HZC30_07225 [Candidatus Woesearchaeota archaeon]|nr:hypothetical protein [Candidatus Woesearchaeota archaeon]